MSAAPRVALVGRYELPFPYSDQQLDYPVQRALADRCERLHIVAQARDGVERTWSEGRLHVHYGPRYRGPLRALRFVAWAARRVRSLHRLHGLDVVNGSDLLGGLVGLTLRPVLGLPVVVQLQGQFLDPSPFTASAAPPWVVAGLARWMARRADVVRCLYTRSAELARAAGAAPERVAVVPSRCDPDLFDPARHAATPAPDRLIFVGNLIPGKGVHHLLHAVADVARTHPRVALAVVGSGPEERALRELAERLGVAERVDFVGRVPHATLPALIAAASAFVFPSLSEATPRAVMEAMAMARPVVASDVGGIPDLVVDGAHGRLVAPGDPAALAAAIRATLDAPEWAREAGRRGRRRVLERFTVAKHLEAMDELHRLAARAGRACPPPGVEPNLSASR